MKIIVGTQYSVEIAYLRFLSWKLSAVEILSKDGA
jgi:hypothetical protein